MTNRRRRLGAWGEARAREYLEAQNCRAVASNWRCIAGEVDIIVLDGDCLAFVEVRTRSSDEYGTPEDSITPRKLARMAAVADSYVQEYGWEGDWRLDVIAIQVAHGRLKSLEWYRDVSLPS